MKSEKLNAILEKIAAFFNTQRHASSIKDGLVAATPFTIIGGIASLIANPPISADFDGSGIFGWFLSGWKALAAWKAWPRSTAKKPESSMIIWIPENSI